MTSVKQDFQTEPQKICNVRQTDFSREMSGWSLILSGGANCTDTWIQHMKIAHLEHHLLLLLQQLALFHLQL